MKNRASRLLFILSMALVLTFPSLGFAQAVEEEPSALAMTGDLLVARPFLLAITAIGSTIYLASLPFTLVGGNSAEAAQVLVIRPAAATFVRCLGCTKVGRKRVVSVADVQE